MDSEQEMNASKEETQEQRHAAVGKDGHGQKPEPHHATKRELDDEIAAIQAHSRHQSTTIQAPPEIPPAPPRRALRSEEHTSELQSPCNLVCRLLLEKKKKIKISFYSSKKKKKKKTN